MADIDRKKGGGKLTRSETVTVRLDPKLRYLAELAARKHRRTVSSYIEWAIEDSLERTCLSAGSDVSLASEKEALWDVDEADRFVKLALRHPELLTHEEQVRWKLIRENGYLWRGRFTGSSNEWTWTLSMDSIVFDSLRKYWPDFCAAAESGDKSKLPTWVKVKKTEVKAKPTTGFDDMDDDIPF